MSCREFNEVSPPPLCACVYILRNAFWKRKSIGRQRSHAEKCCTKMNVSRACKMPCRHFFFVWMSRCHASYNVAGPLPAVAQVHFFVSWRCCGCRRHTSVPTVVSVGVFYFVAFAMCSALEVSPRGTAPASKKKDVISSMCSFSIVHQQQ